MIGLEFVQLHKKLKSRNNTSMAYSNDGYKHKNQFSIKKGSTVHQVSAEDSVNKMLQKKIGFNPNKKSAVSFRF